MSVEEAIESEADVEDLLETLSVQREAIENFVEAIDLLHRSGMLDLLTVLGTHEVDSQEQTFEMFTESENALQLVQNLTLLVNSLSEVDPADLEQFQQFQDEAAEQLADAPDAKPGLLGLFGQMRDADVQRGMAVFLGLLKALGEQLDDHP